MSDIETDRYCDYSHRLHRVGGLFLNFSEHLRSLHEFPHPRDPRRERNLRRLLEYERALNEAPLVIFAETNYERQLRPLVVPVSRTKPILRPSGLPNTRDPRRAHACECNGYPSWSIGPSSLVNNETLELNEETCPVLIIDVSKWPNFKHCWIELLPHERNAARAALEIQLDQIEGFDAGGDDPMLELDSDGLYIECVKACYRGGDIVCPKAEPTDNHLVAFVDLCDDDDVVMETQIPLQPVRTNLSSEIVILDDDDNDDDVEFVEVYTRTSRITSVTLVNEKYEQRLPLVSDVNEFKNYNDHNESVLDVHCTVNQAGNRKALNNLRILKDYTDNREISILNNTPGVYYHVNNKKRSLYCGILNAGIKRGVITIEKHNNGTTLLEKRKREISKSSVKDLVLTDAKRRRASHDDERSGQRCERRLELKPYIRSCNLTWSCLNYFLNHYRLQLFAEFIKINNVMERRKSLSWYRYDQKYDKENCIFIEDVTDTKGCDKIFCTKSSDTILNNQEENILSTNYQLKKFSSIETIFLVNNIISNPVIENVFINKLQELKLNLVLSKNIKRFSSIKQNSLCSALLNKNHNEISNIIFDNKKFKKRHCLPTALILQKHNFTKRFRSKSHDLSIILTLKRDRLNQNNWIALQNPRKYNLESTYFNKKYINEIVENSTIHLQKMCDTSFKVCKLTSFFKEIPKLGINHYKNTSIASKNINNFQNCLSPYLKSLVKKRNSSLTDIKTDSDRNNLCKRRKLSNNFILDKVQKNVNINVNLVESSLNNNLDTKNSVLLRDLSNSSKKLSKINTSILSTCNFLDHNDNNQSESVNKKIHGTKNIASNSYLLLNNKVAKTLCISDKKECLTLCNNTHTKSANKNLNSTDKHFSNSDTDKFKIVEPENIEKNRSLKFDHIINSNCNDIIEKDKKKDKSILQIAENYNNKMFCKSNSKEYININFQGIKNIKSNDQQLELYSNCQLNIMTVENKLLQSIEFCNNNVKFQKLKKKKSNISNNKIKMVTKQNIRKISTSNIEVKVQNTDESNKNLSMSRNEENTEFKWNKLNKGMSVAKNILEYPINSLKNKKRIYNLKESVNTNNFDDNTYKSKQKKNYSDKNFSDDKEINGSDTIESLLHADKVLPSSSGLDEHLEEGDFDFLPSIQKIKYNYDCYDDYDVNSDCDINLEEHGECSINMERKKNDNLINKISVKSVDSKIDDFQKNNCSIATASLQETVPSNNNNIHCLKKLPDFYNKYIIKIVNNKAKIDVNTNIDISGLNLYISDDNDDNLLVKDLKSNFNSKLKTNKSENREIKSKIGINLDDQEINNLNNVKMDKMESKNNEVEKNIQFYEHQCSQKENSHHIEIEDMIVSLCEKYVSNKSANDNLTLPINDMMSSSNTSHNNQLTITAVDKFDKVIKTISSPLTFHIDKSSIDNDDNDLKINLPTFNNYTTSSKELQVFPENSNSNLKIYNRYSDEDESRNLSNEVFKSAHHFTEYVNNNFNVIKEFRSKHDKAIKKIKTPTLISSKNNNLESTLIKSLKQNISSTNIKNKISKINPVQSINLHNTSSPIIFEVSIPSNQKESEDNYDLLKNININLVDEIDKVNDINVFDSTILPSSVHFKLRDINELLEKPEKLKTKKISEDENAVDKFIASSMPIFDTNLFNNSSSEFINKKKFLPTENFNNKCNSLSDLITMNNSTQGPNLDNPQHNYLYQHSYVGQSMFTSITNMINSIPLKKNILHYNMQQSDENRSNIHQPMIYSVINPSTTHQLENIPQNYSISNNLLSSPSHVSNNINGENCKIVLASSIYSNFYADSGIVPKNTVFNLELPPFEILAIYVPYIVNVRESSDSNNRKIIEYKKMLLNKIFFVLKSIETITPHRYKKYKNTLLNYSTLTEDTWNFQLKIITIKQCVFSFFNLTTNKNFQEILQAIINSIDPTEVPRNCLSNLKDAIELYNNLQQKGIISKSAHNKQPLLLEIESMQNKNQLQIPMAKDQKQKFINQVLFYYKIINIK